MSTPADPFGGYEFRPFRAFSAEQHRQLAIEYGVRDGETHGKLMDTMANVSEMYLTQRNFEEYYGSIKLHRERLERIAAAARILRQHLAEETLTEHLFYGLSDAEKFTDRLQDSDRINRTFISNLGHLVSTAGELASNPDELRILRIDPKDGAKSVERREIWEPVFKLWCDLGKELGYTDGGPIMRVLQIMHVALGLEPPNPHSVRQALRDYKGSGVLRVVK
ncbi:hypothetical protein MKK67_05570 [Methylobacterium sp. J-072]|uniref:hypothetical protein n=1 Tax=Methylobacterium sp. J-072 TaxID=2836651 RepID=UPI001FBB88C0|nr:hypothetical protein [Methylobacterium sp. J-072]MCJ2091974.1 hypothetical protein [Methylobacterium sp. J-072]